MQLDKKKLARQELGVNLWHKNGKRGTINYWTGVGKTFTAVLCMKSVFRNDHFHNFVILVPSEPLQKQWTAIIQSQFTKRQRNLISIFTPNYIITNEIRIETDTLVVDELHEFYSEERINTINGNYIRYKYNLALTATYEDSKNRQNLIKDIYPIVDKISEEEAIKEGYTTSFVEFNLAVRFTPEEQLKYNVLSDRISKNMSKFGKSGLDLASLCLSGGTHIDGLEYTGIEFCWGWASRNGWRKGLDLNDPAQAKVEEMWNPYTVMGYAKNLMGDIKLRKDLIYGATNKLEVTKAIVFKFEEYQSIVFSQATAFADKLNHVINLERPGFSVAYHSQLKTQMRPSPKTGKLIKFGKTRLKREAVEAIKNGKSTTICTTSVLDKGFDVPNLTLSVTASGTSSFIQYGQRGGRVKRRNILVPNKKALLVNLYIKDTKDETWLSKRQSKSTHIIHWIDRVDEISFNPINKNEFSIDDING
jgi:superfamily II DNA or RNA helicase